MQTKSAIFTLPENFLALLNAWNLQTIKNQLWYLFLDEYSSWTNNHIYGAQDSLFAPFCDEIQRILGGSSASQKVDFFQHVLHSTDTFVTGTTGRYWNSIKFSRRISVFAPHPVSSETRYRFDSRTSRDQDYPFYFSKCTSQEHHTYHLDDTFFRGPGA